LVSFRLLPLRRIFSRILRLTIFGSMTLPPASRNPSPKCLPAIQSQYTLLCTCFLIYPLPWVNNHFLLRFFSKPPFVNIVYPISSLFAKLQFPSFLKMFLSGQASSLVLFIPCPCSYFLSTSLQELKDLSNVVMLKFLSSNVPFLSDVSPTLFFSEPRWDIFLFSRVGMLLRGKFLFLLRVLILFLFVWTPLTSYPFLLFLFCDAGAERVDASPSSSYLPRPASFMNCATPPSCSLLLSMNSPVGERGPCCTRTWILWISFRCCCLSFLETSISPSDVSLLPPDRIIALRLRRRPGDQLFFLP